MQPRHFVIADTHFNHKNILTFMHDGKPVRSFDSVDEMNEYMIACWNDVVKDDDYVDHLGDVSFASKKHFESIFNRLNGKKRLIAGNHDDIKFLSQFFSKIMVSRTYENLLLTHYPVHEHVLGERLAKNGKSFINVHGHTHSASVNDPRYKCVSVEQIGYTPVDIRFFLD